MTLTRRVALNTIVQIGGKIITVLLSLVLVVFLTRYLGVFGYGQYTAIFSYLGFFGVFVDFGLYTIAVREMSGRPEETKKIAGNLLGIRIVMAAFIFTIAAILTPFLPYDPIIKTGMLIGVFSIAFIILTQASFSVFQTNLRMDFAVVAEVLGRIGVLLLTLFFISKGYGLYFIVLAYVLGNLIMFLISFLLVQRFVKFFPLFEFKEWNHLIKESLPLGITAILGMLHFKIDTILLSILPLQGNLSNIHEVGIYGASYKILEILLSLPVIFVGSLFPILSSQWYADKAKAKEVFQKGFDMLLVISLPMVSLLILLSPIIINIIGGKEFAASAIPLKILSFAVGFTFMSSIFSSIIVVARKQKLLIIMTSIALAINVIFNLIFIPRYSYIGAAAVTVLSEFSVLLILFFLTAKFLKVIPRFLNLFKILLATMVTTATTYFLINKVFIFNYEASLLNKLFVFSVIGSSAMVVYLILLGVVGVLNKDLIEQLIKRN